MSFLSHDTSALKYQCIRCSYKFQWKFALSHHFKRYHQKISMIPFSCSVRIEANTCNICVFETDYQVRLFWHQKRKHLTEASEGNTVSRNATEFIKQELLDIKPETVELEEGENQCFKCGLFTFSQVFLFKHLITCRVKTVHNLFYNNDTDSGNINWFKCQYCSFKTKWKHGLKSHQTNVHNIGEVKWFECLVCNYKSKRNVTLKRHHINQHNIEEIKWFKCNYCNYQAKEKANLTSHQMRKHNIGGVMKLYECHNCDFKTKWKNYLKRHEITKHNVGGEIKWLKCQLCSYKTKRKDNLKRHQITKHNVGGEVAWFKCQNCSYKSKRKDHLKSHRINQHNVEDEVK